MKFTDWFTQDHDADVRARVRVSTTLRMSDSEREKGRAFLERHIALYPARAARPVSRFAFMLHPMPLIASLLIVVVSGVSVAGAAEAALPGDALYSVKVNMNEEVKLALARSPEKKAAVTLERAERRLQELATLNERGDVSETLRAEIDDRLDAHVHAAEVTGTEVDESSARDIERRVVALLRAHEGLVSPGAIGGFAEPTIDVALVAAADNGAAELMAVSAPADAEPAGAMMVETRAAAPTIAARSAIVEDAPLQESPETMLMTAEAPLAKQESATHVPEKVLTRQEKTARERIESLEKLIARAEKQNAKRAEKLQNARDTSILTAGLMSARDAFENAKLARKNGNSPDASALFNSAIRFSIDAREAYAEENRAHESERETRDNRRASEDRTRRTDDSREDETDDRSGRSRDRDD